MENIDCQILEIHERIKVLIKDLRDDIKDLESIIEIEEIEESKTDDVL